jgi:hypothetical protein
MKTLLTVTYMILLSLSARSQEHSRFSVSANFGLNGNFFVRSYDEENAPGIVFYDKNFIGTAGGIEVGFQLNQRSSFTAGYMRSENSRLVDFYGSNNGIFLDIMSFRIRHIEHIFFGGYQYHINKPKGLIFEGGIFYSRTIQQEIELFGNSINIWERKYGNARLNELGVFAGIQYKRPIADQLDLGIQSRLFYEFTSNILSQITLTPTLTYHFRKSTRKTTKSTS